MRILLVLVSVVILIPKSLFAETMAGLGVVVSSQYTWRGYLLDDAIGLQSNLMIKNVFYASAWDYSSADDYEARRPCS